MPLTRDSPDHLFAIGFGLPPIHSAVGLRKTVAPPQARNCITDAAAPKRVITVLCRPPLCLRYRSLQIVVWADGLVTR